MGYGLEIDILNHGDELFVIHSSFSKQAITLSEWLLGYNH